MLTGCLSMILHLLLLLIRIAMKLRLSIPLVYPRRDLPGCRIRRADRSSRGSCRRFGFEMGCLVCTPADDRSLLLKPYGKIPLCLLRLALAEDFGHEGRAARADHEADAAQHHDKRHHEVDGREWRLPGEVRHEQAVYHAVDRREDHHHD